jgi:phenylalanyl-tRNA synthetase alpha chain
MLPGCEWRTVPSPHPYTEDGVQIDVKWQGQWVEVGECGRIASAILQNAHLTTHSGLAMGLGLDRLLMIRKNIPDIRLLRHSDSRVQEQMQDLSAYQPVSMMPATVRDLSLVVSEQEDIDTLGDKIRQQYNNYAVIESLAVVNETPYRELPESARLRLGLEPDQKNLLLRLVIRAMDRTLTSQEANDVRNGVYRLLHQGKTMEIAEHQ